MDTTPSLVANVPSKTADITATNATSSLSEEELYSILVQFNDSKATLYIPVIVYMIILTIVGGFGNILVCFVYCCKSTKTSSTFFILTLAILDLLTCLIGMPTEITDLRFPYMFYAKVACKLLRFVESVTTIGSSMILIAVAVDRYLRICKLGKMISVPCAKRICISAMIVGVFLSWPAFFIFGESTTQLHPGVKGVDCSTDDSMRDTHYPSLYYGFLGLLFVCCIVFFSVIYSQIGLQIWRQKRAKIGGKIHRESDVSKRTFSSSSTKECHSVADGSGETPPEVASEQASSDMSSEQMNESLAKKNCAKTRRMSSVSYNSPPVKSSKKRTIKVTRTTVVLFVVTVAYIISFLPFLVIMVYRSVNKDFEDNLTNSEEVAFKFAVKSYFINNAINPLIYSFLNLNFRTDARNFLMRVMKTCCFCRRTNI